MNPASFVGIPDWLSVILALAFALPWLVLVARGRLKSLRLWAVLALAAALFPFSIAWVQVPAQSTINALWGLLFDPATLRAYLPAVALPGLLVASIVQETVKLAVAALGIRLLGARRNPEAGLALGAAAGAGFGGFEAFWVFNQIFAAGWTLAVVQMAGPVALLGFVERFIAVPFHVGSAALAAYGYTTGRPWRFWLAAVGLHTLVNYAAILPQMGLRDMFVIELWIGVVAAATIAWAILLRRRAARGLATAG